MKDSGARINEKAKERYLLRIPLLYQESGRTIYLLSTFPVRKIIYYDIYVSELI